MQLAHARNAGLTHFNLLLAGVPGAGAWPAACMGEGLIATGVPELCIIRLYCIVMRCWQVFLEPALGWRPAWERGLMATAVLGSFIIRIVMCCWGVEHDNELRIKIVLCCWQVFLEPALGWRPAWERGLMATAVLGSVIIAVLVGTILASWAQQQKLLAKVMVSRPSNSHLGFAGCFGL
jgi:hypothetical protein